MTLLPAIFLYRWELSTMPEYSTSIPTGTVPWKMWRHREGADWYVGQYVEVEDPKVMGIRWFRVVLREGPVPRGYHAPDWDNHERWKRDRRADRAQAHGS